MESLLESKGMMKKLCILAVVLCASQSHAVVTNLLRNRLHNRADTEKSILALRKLPLTLSLGSDYILQDGLPMRSGLQRFVFELYQGAAALTELTTNATVHAVTNAFIGIWFGPNVVLHEVGGHGHANKIFIGSTPMFRDNAEKTTKKREFLPYLPRGLFSYGGSTVVTGAVEREKWPEGIDAYFDLDDGTQTGDRALKDAAIKKLLSTKENFDFFQRYTRISYAGINMEIEQARYVSHRILQGEVVRPEAIIAYAALGVFTYFQNEGDGLGNDANMIAAYYDAIGCPKGSVKRARMMSVIGLLCSGTLWSFARAYWRLERVKPIWLFDRVLMPNFYIFYTLKGTSLMVESAVRINDKWFIDFGSEWVIDNGKDPFTKEKYTGVDFRLGAVWRCCEGLTVAAFSLVNHFGGAAELTYANPDKHFGLSLGASWSSDKSLCGERMANYSFDSKGRELSGYVRLSYII